jgi:hypothetical protein
MRSSASRRRCAGSQFDPSIVPVFEQVVAGLVSPAAR